jgi:hypothetical protein
VRWFRTRQGSTTGVALFALLVQSVLSFGHVHIGSTGHAPSFSVAHSHDNDGATVPAHDHDERSPAGFCAIWATVNLLSASQIAAPPTLPAQTASSAVPAPIPTFAAPPEHRRAAFRSRAPPLA